MRDHLFGSVQTVQAIAQAQAPTPERWPARPLLLEGEPATLGSVRRFIDAVLVEVGKRSAEDTFGELFKNGEGLSDFKNNDIPCEQWRAIVAKGHAAIDKHRTARLDRVVPPYPAQPYAEKIEVGDTVEVTKEQFAGRQGIVLEMGVGAEAYVKLKYINCGPIVSGLWTIPNLKLVSKGKQASTEIEVGDTVEVTLAAGTSAGQRGIVIQMGIGYVKIKYLDGPIVSALWLPAHLKLVSKASKPQSGKAWHKGPPPHIGVWQASMSEWLNTFRYWNGTHWSYRWLASSSPETIANCKRTVMLAPQMRWYGYQPDEDGFIKWDGGDCPVEPGTHIRFKMRSYDGDHHRNGRPCSEPETLWPGWAHRQQPNDIVAYKVVQ